METIWESILKTEKSNEEDSLSILKKIPLFNNLSNKELKEVEKIMYYRHFRENEHIFHQGDPGLGMYIIVKGMVKIIDEKAETGKNIIAILNKGDFFGELSLLAEEPRSASAISSEESAILGFFRPDFLDLLKRKPKLGNKILLNLANIIGERLKKTNQLLIEERKKSGKI
ncbi:MAG: cyclic nucleotide-binding domain-containing protein [Candidatus Marinimicrobia bacterium]|nr:cyclic nucleotide-binding domain-containing protein [Candidatus Neomarinimicrobiota bacterium]